VPFGLILFFHCGNLRRFSFSSSCFFSFNFDFFLPPDGIEFGFFIACAALTFNF